jgi:hypothetical protein
MDIDENSLRTYPPPMASASAPVERIVGAIQAIRGERVLLDADLAMLYGVSTKRLNEQVRRNGRRFPRDFMFRLTAEEAHALRSQFATSKRGRGGRRNRPFAFTEHGAIMLASVLNSSVAIDASIQVVRAFVRLRRILVSHAELAGRVAALERQYDARFKVVFDAIRGLMAPPAGSTRRIGFRPTGQEANAPSARALEASARRSPRGPSRRGPGGGTR